VKHLADVNLLVALVHPGHSHHARASFWYASLPSRSTVLTCSITELGFLRALINSTVLADVPTAQMTLSALKSSGRFDFLPLALAKRHGAKFTTFDTGIIGADLVR
jgi:predicted nucleic acid-binding protein